MSVPSSVLFVCLGNICRSPTAEGVFRSMVAATPLAGKLTIDSAGTSANHIGSPPNPRSIVHAAKRAVDLSALRARQITASDFERFDLVLAMDGANLKRLQALCPSRWHSKLAHLLDFGGDEDEIEVPDPYYGDAADFELVLDLVEVGCEGLLEHVLDAHSLTSRRF